jgi:hypothetical protein
VARVRRAPKALRGARVAVAGLLLFWGSEARAGGPLAPNKGDPITTSQYTVDLYQGPILASSRITAMGGAYTAIADGADGIIFNPAAASVRAPYSTKRIDWDLTGGITLPTSITNTDFDNNGDTNYQTRNFVWANAGGYLQFNHLGVGLIASGQNYVLNQPRFIPIPDVAEGADKVIIRLLKIDAVASYGFLDDQIHVGAGIRTAHFGVVGSARDAPAGATTNDDLRGDARERLFFVTNSIGAQGGVLWMPRELPLRIGGTARSPVYAAVDKTQGRFKADAQGDIRAGEPGNPDTFYFPERVDLPWEVEAGLAVQFWKRPLNIPWTNEENVPDADSEPYRRKLKDKDELEPSYKAARRMLKQRYKEIPREKVLLSGSVLVSGPVKNGVGFESMLARRVERSGELTNVSVRFGVETEVIPYWLVLRGGSYLEPSRFREGSARLHGTAGFQVKVLEWDVFGLFDEAQIFRISTAIDVARGYLGWSIGAGLFL